MLKNFVIFLFIIKIILLTGCATVRQPSNPQYSTGTQISNEWNEYNLFAKDKDMPTLDFMATTLKYKYNEGPVLSYDNFLVNDPQVTVQTKWSNAKASDVYEFLFYMPDGRLYHYDYFQMKEVHSKYTVGRNMPIKGLFPAEIQGMWKVDIVANNTKVMSKNFSIGDARQAHNNVNPNVRVGITPFIDHESQSSWKHGTALSAYIGWQLLAEFSAVEIIPPLLIRKNIRNININYENMKDILSDDLKSVNSIILEIANEQSLDYIVTGRVLSKWQNNSSVTRSEIYVIDVRKKSITDVINGEGLLYRSDFNIANQDRVLGMHPNRIKVYKQIMKKTIQNLSKTLTLSN